MKIGAAARRGAAAHADDTLPVLHELLSAGAGQHAEVAEGFSNQQPMALISLQALGASGAQLQAFATQYGTQVPPAPPPQDWPLGDAWAGRFGDMRAWLMYRSLFRQWLLHEGAADVLTQVLPQLMPGCSAAAFHGLIRTAQGVRAGHAGEIADGLAYWAARWQSLGPVAAPARQTAPDLLTALRGARRAMGPVALPKQSVITQPVTQPITQPITQVMAAVAAQPGFGSACARVPRGADLPAAVAGLAAQLFVRHGDFAALQLVIAARAVERLRPFFDEADALFGAFAQTAVAGVLCTGLPLPADLGRDEAELPPPPAWAALLKRVRNSTDAHVIQLVDACCEHGRALGGTVWRRAAARALDTSSRA